MKIQTVRNIILSQKDENWIKKKEKDYFLGITVNFLHLYECLNH